MNPCPRVYAFLESILPRLLSRGTLFMKEFPIGIVAIICRQFLQFLVRISRIRSRNLFSLFSVIASRTDCCRPSAQREHRGQGREPARRRAARLQLRGLRVAAGGQDHVVVRPDARQGRHAGSALGERLGTRTAGNLGKINAHYNITYSYREGFGTLCSV